MGLCCSRQSVSEKASPLLERKMQKMRQGEAERVLRHHLRNCAARHRELPVSIASTSGESREGDVTERLQALLAKVTAECSASRIVGNGGVGASCCATKTSAVAVAIIPHFRVDGGNAKKRSLLPLNSNTASRNQKHTSVTSANDNGQQISQQVSSIVPDASPTPSPRSSRPLVGPTLEVSLFDECDEDQENDGHHKRRRSGPQRSPPEQAIVVDPLHASSGLQDGGKLGLREEFLSSAFAEVCSAIPHTVCQDERPSIRSPSYLLKDAKEVRLSLVALDPDAIVVIGTIDIEPTVNGTVDLNNSDNRKEGGEDCAVELERISVAVLLNAVMLAPSCGGGAASTRNRSTCRIDLATATDTSKWKQWIDFLGIK